MGQPGEKIDLSTFIAYLLPGFIVESLVFALADSLNLIVSRKSLLINIVFNDAARLVVLGAVLVILGYFLGVLIDMYAHVFTGKYENARKNEAYQDVVKDLGGYVKDRKLKLLLLEQKDNSYRTRNTFIDAMYYQYATSNHWSRQNWSWSFYEASRNLVILFMPTFLIWSLYISVATMIGFSIETGLTIVISLATSVIISIIMWRFPYRQLKDYRDTICRVYHRHRAYVVLSALINSTRSKQ